MKKEYQAVKQAYPILINKNRSNPNEYLVYIPDFESNTSGNSLVDAIEMARNAISEEGLAKQDLGLPIPPPTLTIKPQKDEILSFVDIDLDKYRRLTDSRAVKKTVTIPSYLNEIGKKRGVNFSLILTDALKKKLGV